MNIQPDFEELLRLFGNHDVDYMIVGGYADLLHNKRSTKRNRDKVDAEELE
jgi:hypothetical protein